MEGAQDSSIITMETAPTFTADATEDKNKAVAVPVTTADHGGDQMKKKKRGGMNLIRVALFMLRRHSGKSKTSVHAEVASKGLWKKLLGSMRPLHLQHNQSPPPSFIEAPPSSAEEAASVEAPVTLQITNEQFEEVLPPPVSPISTSSIGSSRYASAVNLQELDRSEEEEEEEEEDCEKIMGDDNGDTMIDAKAEEFIAHFYEQMRLQRIDSIKRYNKMMERRMG